MKTKSYLLKELDDGNWTIFRKRLFGYKRMIPGAFPTLYVALTYLNNTDNRISIQQINVKYD